jgi:hypothetical protein
MGDVKILDQPNDSALAWDQVLDLLAGMEGERVAVRIVASGDPEALLAVFRGRLRAATTEKYPTLFFPVTATSENDPDDFEETGVCLQQDRFQSAVERGEQAVVVIAHDPVIINIRKLADELADAR